MKQSIILLPLAILALTSCRPNTTDDANDASGTGGAELARAVVGVRMLSSDAKYEEAGNYLAEEFVRGTFELGEDTKLEVTNTREGAFLSGIKTRLSFPSAQPGLTSRSTTPNTRSINCTSPAWPHKWMLRPKKKRCLVQNPEAPEPNAPLNQLPVWQPSAILRRPMTPPHRCRA